MGNFLNKVFSTSSRSNRIKGQIKTVVVPVILYLANSPELDSHPVIKMVTTLVAGILTRDVYNHATTVGE